MTTHKPLADSTINRDDSLWQLIDAARRRQAAREQALIDAEHARVAAELDTIRSEFDRAARETFGDELINLLALDYITVENRDPRYTIALTRTCIARVRRVVNNSERWVVERVEQPDNPSAVIRVDTLNPNGFLLNARPDAVQENADRLLLAIECVPDLPLMSVGDEE